MATLTCWISRVGLGTGGAGPRARVGRPAVPTRCSRGFPLFREWGGGAGPPTFLTSALPWSLLPSRGWSQVNRGQGQGRWGLAGVVWGFILAPGSLPCPLRAGPGTAPGRDSQSGLGLGVNSLLTPSLLASTNLFFPGGLQSTSLGARTLWIHTHPSLSLFPLHSSLTPMSRESCCSPCPTPP